MVITGEKILGDIGVTVFVILTACDTVIIFSLSNTVYVILYYIRDIDHILHK